MELEMAWVSDESDRKFTLVPKHLVTEADAAAKAALADSDMCGPPNAPSRIVYHSTSALLVAAAEVRAMTAR